MTADDLIDEGAVSAKAFEVGTPTRQQRVPDRVLEIAVSTFYGTVFMHHSLVVPRGGHPVMRAEPVVAFGEIGSGLGITIAEGGRQAVAAVQGRGTAHGPQCVLQTLRQGNKALTTQNDMGVLGARPWQVEVVEQMR